MELLRTPDDRFADLPGFAYEPNYTEIDDGDGGSLRVHYVDEGPADAAPVLLMHGEPSWSYLYRHMITPLVEAGHRVVAPDLVGFGRSDKPTERSDYSYAAHVAWMRQAIVEQLDLSEITLFCQDWGGLIGLRLVADSPERFARVATSNTGLPTGHGKPTQAFLDWQRFSQEVPEFPVGPMIDRATTTDLGDDVIAAYDAPFPDESYKAGARIFPALVPTSLDDPASPDNIAAWEVLAQFDRPWLCCFSDSDPVTRGADKWFTARVPGARHDRHVTVEGGGHFVQEDCGPELADILNEFIATG